MTETEIRSLIAGGEKLQPEAYVRSNGISAARHEAMVEEFARAHGKVVRQNVAELCDLNGPQATRLLKKMGKSANLAPDAPPRTDTVAKLFAGLLHELGKADDLSGVDWGWSPGPKAHTIPALGSALKSTR